MELLLSTYYRQGLQRVAGMGEFEVVASNNTCFVKLYGATGSVIGDSEMIAASDCFLVNVVSR